MRKGEAMIRKPLIVVAAILLLQVPALAGERPKEGQDNPLAAAVNFVSDAGHTTVRDFVEFLDGAGLWPWSVVMKPGVEDIGLPALNLKNARLIDVLSILSQEVDNLEVRLMVGEDELPLDALEPDNWEDIRRRRPTLVIGLARLLDVFEPVDEDFRIYRIGKILENHKVEGIATAIETAWKMMSENYPSSLKFHEDTELLICTGTEKQLLVVDRVVEQLGGNDAPVTQAKKLQQLESENRKLRDALIEQQKLTSESISKLARAVEELNMSAGATNAQAIESLAKDLRDLMEEIRKLIKATEQGAGGAATK